jgi:pyruvate kinase
MVRGLVEAGATVFRINTSHGSSEEHRRAVELVRATEEASGRPLSVLADLPGPKVRLGDLRPDPFAFRPGQRFELRPEGPGDERGASTTHPGLARDLRAGDRVLLADGAVELTVASTDGDVATLECVRGGSVRSHQGVNVPAERLSLPAVTERDRTLLAGVLGMGVDLVAQSFVRSSADVEELRALMGERPVPIVAKIETRPAVDDFSAILAVADAAMVARGDLGVELPMERIPLVQKRLLGEGRAAGRPVIVATQMLESMIRAPRPTRAEANDVATAVLDGADAIMLSAETAIGDFPFGPRRPRRGSPRRWRRRGRPIARRSRTTRTRARPPPWHTRRRRSWRATPTSWRSRATRPPAGRPRCWPRSGRPCRSTPSSPTPTSAGRTACCGASTRCRRSAPPTPTR